MLFSVCIEAIGWAAAAAEEGVILGSAGWTGIVICMYVRECVRCMHQQALQLEQALQVMLQEIHMCLRCHVAYQLPGPRCCRPQCCCPGGEGGRHQLGLLPQVGPPPGRGQHPRMA